MLYSFFEDLVVLCKAQSRCSIKSMRNDPTRASGGRSVTTRSGSKLLSLDCCKYMPATRLCPLSYATAGTHGISYVPETGSKRRPDRRLRFLLDDRCYDAAEMQARRIASDPADTSCGPRSRSHLPTVSHRSSRSPVDRVTEHLPASD